jgi:hypothetical protein
MRHREILEQHEARLRLYVRLLDGMGGVPSGQEARETVLELVRREVEETDRVAEMHLHKLSGDQEREAFRYAMTLLLPYYTHLARIYGRRHRSWSGSVPAARAG